MILNHKAAIEILVDEADHIGFNRYTILNLHAVLADNLLPTRGPAVGSGTSASESAAPCSIRSRRAPEMEECFDQILASAEAMRDPFEQSFFVMVHFPYLQPFEDVNKRVSRLAANIPLIRHNLWPLSFVDVPQRDYVTAFSASTSWPGRAVARHVRLGLPAFLRTATGRCGSRWAIRIRSGCATGRS